MYDLRRSGLSIVNFYFTTFSSVSNVNFDQVNVCLVVTTRSDKYFLKNEKLDIKLL